ncbi:MAG: hypothetical protein ACFCUX_01570 [Candidatus Methylacidiphilales bacterium]
MEDKDNCPEFLKIAPGIVSWSVYSEECKTHLFSHAHVFQQQLVLIDPVIPKNQSVWRKISPLGTPNLIILTNGNHERDSQRFAEEFSLPIASSAEAARELSRKPDIILDGQVQLQGLKPIPSPGGGPGELALFSPSAHLLILGDAVINLPSTGLQLLPEKYRTESKKMILSLATLLNLPFETVLMAHGLPLIHQSKAQLRKLLSQ